jgi:hypothetical protein
MSLLVTDADECATLEATLAFLDAWEAPSTDSGSTGSPSSTPTLAAVTPARCLTPQQKQQQIDHHSVKTKPKKPRRKYPNSSSTVLQRRKKAEILALRAQVEQLELQLQQLKKVPGAALVVAEDALAAVSSGSTTWAEQAAAQYRGRLRAEKTNAKLKSVMANQVKASEALRSLLQKTAALDGMAFVLQNPCRPLDGASFEMELLEQRVERLYLHADAVYKPDELEWLGLRANVRQHDALGKVLEIVSTTPMMCSVQAASEALWEWLSLTEVVALSLHCCCRLLTNCFGVAAASSGPTEHAGAELYDAAGESDRHAGYQEAELRAQVSRGRPRRLCLGRRPAAARVRPAIPQPSVDVRHAVAGRPRRRVCVPHIPTALRGRRGESPVAQRFVRAGVCVRRAGEDVSALPAVAAERRR